MIKVEEMSDCYKKMLVKDIAWNIMTIIIYMFYLMLFFNLSLTDPSIVHFACCFSFIAMSVCLVVIARRKIIKDVTEILDIKE